MKDLIDHHHRMGLFRSKSCSLPDDDNNSPKPSPAAPYQYDSEEEDAMEEEDDEAHTEYVRLRRRKSKSCADIPDDINLIGGAAAAAKGRRRWKKPNAMIITGTTPFLSVVLAALRKSLLLTCTIDSANVVIGDDGHDDLDIGWPIDACHVTHVTFDPFNGFSGLPMELQNELPPKVPSASVNVFGISAKSMKWGEDGRGNSVPTVLLMLQERLYSEGGLQEEGIFRINAENSQDEYVRNHLRRAVLPSHHIDVHCLAGLIKAWFRELPEGVLDSLTPEQVMHCNTEEECTQLIKLLPPTEAQLLDWAINLMADVVLQSDSNKMNSRNIAMVFAPNMTQMADPLTALIHAVQVMNLLKTLIEKTIKERAANGSVSSAAESPNREEVESDVVMEGNGVVSDERLQYSRLDGNLECLEYSSGIGEKLSYGVKGDDVDEALRKVSECVGKWISAPNILSRSQSLGTGSKSDEEARGIERRSMEAVC